VNAAFERGLELAEALEDHDSELRLLAGLNRSLSKLADFGGALAVAERYAAIAERLGDLPQIVRAEWMLGGAHHFAGHQEAAQRHYEKGFSTAAALRSVHVDYFGYDYHIRALAGLAQTLWLRGKPEQALRYSHQAIEIVKKDDRPVTSCVCLIYLIPIFLRSKDLESAEVLIDRLLAICKKHSLNIYRAAGHVLMGDLMIARGEADSSIALLRNALLELHVAEYYTLEVRGIRVLAEGLLLCGQAPEALREIDAALARSGLNGPAYDSPALMRTRGEILLALPQSDADAAEQALVQSLEWARGQGALAWELGSAISLARLWAEQGQVAKAIELLVTVCQGFTEGFDTAGLREAARLIHLFRTTLPVPEPLIADS
jgi:tetratricopeptide (TPR) repeat protein